MKNLKYVLGVSEATVLLAACNPTANGPGGGGNGGGRPSAPTTAYSAINVTHALTNPQITTGPASIVLDKNGSNATGTITAGGATYNLTGHTQKTAGTRPPDVVAPLAANLGAPASNWQSPYYDGYTLLADYDPKNPQGPAATVLAGQHVLWGAIDPRATRFGSGAFTGMDEASIIIGGQQTQSLPTQTANYVGEWAVQTAKASGYVGSTTPAHCQGQTFCAYSDLIGANGLFTSTADFNSRTWSMNLAGMNAEGASGSGGNITIVNPVSGTGSGTITGTTFAGSFNTTGGFVSKNTVNGQFYGPNAEELGGIIQGQSNGEQTYGIVYGHR
ncbi:transferrin-binding protein-like solute binding protein [Devosia sp. 2618]|uniref:transferrin-binding protein-like solute binding protein n=1 Tax=Devosia sp. 2618 TaxID=3156454 RepID=UPI00339187D9